MATTNRNDIEKAVNDRDLAAVVLREAVHFRQIGAAQEGVSRANRERHEDMREAREAGDSWGAYRDGVGCDRAGGAEALRPLTGRGLQSTRWPLRHCAP